MKWLKFSLFVGVFTFVFFAISMLFVEENKTFKVEREVHYGLEKIYPEFRNPQNLPRWNDFLMSKNDLNYTFFTPYEGLGASLHYENPKDFSDFGDWTILEEIPLKQIKYVFYEANNATPFVFNITFKPIGEGRTKIIWDISTPKQSLLRRYINLFSEDNILEHVEKSIKNLSHILGNKINKEILLASIRYDSIVVEPQEKSLILGITENTLVKKGTLLKNIVDNHNKLLHFVRIDLGKKEDEFGDPVLIQQTSTKNHVSYFYGVPISRKINLSDHNFQFRTFASSQNYALYYKGTYENRGKSITSLFKKAKKDSVKTGTLREVFLKIPEEGKDVLLKLSLPVYK